MENLYLSLTNLLTATKRRVAAFAIAVMALLPVKLFGQAPTVSYSGPQTYSTYKAISPLTPTASGVAAPTGSYSSPVILGSGLTFSQNGLAVDAAGNMYVNDQSSGTGNVTKISADGSSTTVIASGFLAQSGNVAVDKAGNVYLADQASVWKIPASGSPVTYGTPVTIGSFSRPFGIAVDAPGNIYVADLNAGVYKMANDGSNNVKIDNGISSPSAVAVDAAGNVYAVSITTLALYEIPANGSPQVQLASGFGFPRGLAVDAAGTIYVDDEAAGGIYAVPAGGGTPAAAVPGLPNLVGVAVDANYNLYGALQGNGGVSKFSPTGGYFISPALPAGLSLDNTTGIISGTPTKIAVATNYLVSAYNAVGGGSATVNITVNGNAGLSNFTTSQGTLSPSFAPATTSYTASVGNAVTSITVTPVTIDPNATVTVNGTTVVSGLASGNLPLSVGSNTITTMVTAANGTTTKTYTLTVTRAPSANADLSNLVTNAGAFSPSFAPGTTGYTLSVGNAVTSIAITPTTADSTATVTVNATTVASGSASGSLHLSVGDNIISTIIKAQDGTTIKTYTVTVTRAPSTNADLSNLATNGGALTPGFANGTTAYSVSVPYATSQIAVTPATADADATVTVNGTSVASGSPSGAIALGVGANNVTIIVTASDHSSTKTYTVTVTRAPSNNAQLSSAGLGYTTDGSGNTYAIVTPIVAGDGATVTVNGTTVASGAPSSPILLSPGSNTVVITVTAQNGVTKLTYKITVMGPLSGISTLSGLTISAGTLSGAFSTNNTSYSDVVNGAVTSVIITPTTSDPNASVTVNGTAVNSGTASGDIALPVGNTAIPTVVTAQDGVTTTTYTITVTRLSNNDCLSALAISSGTLSPAFANATISYADTVTNSVASVTVTPTKSDINATIRVNGSVVGSGRASGSLPLAVGVNAINIAVTAQDGSVKTYTLTVTRKPLSAIATLSSLSVSQGTLSPAFAPATTTYSATVSNATATVTVTPSKTDPNATIRVNGTVVGSGRASGSLALTVGSNTISIVVTAQDGTTTQTYTLKITRQSNNADLSNLVVSTGTLNPAFASVTTAYSVSVNNGTTTIKVTPTKSDANAAIRVNGVIVGSGQASASQPLTVGVNSIPIAVTAQDGTVKTYTVTVTRASGLSSVATLSSLTVSSGTLSPVFAGTTNNYTDTVSNSTTSVTVTPTKTDANATISVNGTVVSSGQASASILLPAATTTISIVVTAQDGTTQTYTLKVIQLSNDASLTGLSVSSGTLSPAFLTGTISYADTVSNATSLVTITAITGNAGASVKINGTAVAPGMASPAIPLSIATNTISVVVTAQDGVTTQTYTLKVTRISNNAYLTGLSLSAGTLSPAFATGTVAYTASVSNGTSTIKVTPVAGNAAEKIKINSTTVSSGTASGSIALTVGTNVISTVVTAQDGTTIKTYTITVTRAPSSLNSFYLPGGDEQTPFVFSSNQNVEANNILSPNGDGINDIWVVKGIAFYPNNTVTVYDRAGKVVFTKKGYTNDWDGSYRGATLSEGTYYYLVDLGNGASKKGFITVISH